MTRAAPYRAASLATGPGATGGTGVIRRLAGAQNGVTTIIAASADEAVARVPDGSRVLVPPRAPGPVALLSALGRRQWESGLSVVTSYDGLPHELLANRGIRIRSWQLFPRSRPHYESGRIEYLPARYGGLGRLLREHPPGEPQVLLAQFAFDESEAAVSPSLCASIAVDMLEMGADLVVGEVNRALPFTFTERRLQLSDIDVALVTDEPVLAPATPEPAEQERTIAEHVASLIPDGATLQFGIGGVGDAVLACLRGHRNLGIHSGMVSEGVVQLMESGAVTNSQKGLLDGRTVTGLAHPGPRLVPFLDHNADFLFVPTNISHGAAALVHLKRFVSINSAIEVDLSGQVNAEYLGGRQFSGVGGQADFSFAASACMDGVSIVAMPSTAKNGASRIVPQLSSGAVVTSPRYCVDYVVTEYGAAALRFGTLAERARALTHIAHPAHRESLEQAASALT